MKRNSFLLIIFLLLFFQALLGAQETAEQELPDETSILIEDTETPAEEAAPAGPAITAWDVIRMILILVCVLVAIYVIFYFMRKIGGPQFTNSELIALRGSLGLGGNKSVHLIETGQEFFLVGAGENGVNLISKIDSKEAVDDLRFKISTGTPSVETKNFTDIFARMFRKSGSGVTIGNSMSRNKEFMKEQQERLKKM